MDRTLRRRPFVATHVLVTGANGYVGAMVVASLLRDSAARITCLVRAGHHHDDVLAPIVDEWQHQSGSVWSLAVERRISMLTLPDDLADLSGLAPQGVDEIVHCAGCLDYHHTAKLQAANLWYTAHLIALARRLKPARLVYVSSAFSGGYRHGVIPETRLDEPDADPTPYTRSKREAERLVAAGGVPFIVLRPAILIGDSRSGRYTGKAYGLYQQWTSLEQLTCDRYHREFHTVAADTPLNLVHQDAFCAGFKAAHRWLPDGSYMNLVSSDAALPSLRELWHLWFDVTRPAVAHLYPAWGDIAVRRIDLRQRTYLTFAKVNLQIALHRWRFETGWLDALRAQRMQFFDATAASVRTCQDRFVSRSPAMQRYLSEHAAELAVRTRVVDVAAATAAADVAKLLPATADTGQMARPRQRA